AQNTQEAITEEIKVNRLNRVVVAACTPRTHEPLFQETLKNAGLNRCLFEMANIRDHCSWVHSKDPEAATRKAKDLVRMAVAKAKGLSPLPEQSLSVTSGALVVGGGVAGMVAALTIAGQGFSCFLVEKDKALGGNARRIESTLSGDSPRQFVEALEKSVRSHPLIHVHTGSQVESVSGYVGNFQTSIVAPEGPKTLEHGAVVLATGGVGYEPRQYLHGESGQVLTQAELEEKLGRPGEAEKLNNVVMIQCVGSRGEDLAYCSKVCCGQAVKNALKLLELNPRANVTVLYRDMRTYGFMEESYTRAREKGISFISFEKDQYPRVEEEQGRLRLSFFDGILGEDVVLDPDFLVLSVGIRPSPVEALAKELKVPLTSDGFFLEAHPKLKPVEFSVDGVFLCGAAHSPKPISETIAQAEAAAGKACILLSKGAVSVEPTVSVVDTEKCTGCGICEKLCPYAAIRMIRIGKKRKAETIAASCKGCGICASHCPALCISMGGFTNEQIMSQIKAFAAG
ncbi:MAG: FAD-dependent oxidoreductase, partial [Thermodesulfobacteriota bacterium]|nr:FAD-dependent oxidoreductase [Thermodesulfobacteriota bacterium]